MRSLEASPPSMLLKDIAESLFMGVNLGRVRGGTDDDAAVPVIHVKDITDGVLPAPDDLVRVSLPDTSQYRRQRLLPSDLLVSARGTLMKCSVVPDSHRGAVASANFIVIRLGNVTLIQAELLCAYLSQPAVKEHILSRVTNTVQAALTIRDLENLSIPLPPQDIQPTLLRLLTVSEEQYRTAIHIARLRREEAMDIVAQYMDTAHAS